MQIVVCSMLGVCGKFLGFGLHSNTALSSRALHGCYITPITTTNIASNMTETYRVSYATMCDSQTYTMSEKVACYQGNFDLG